MSRGSAAAGRRTALRRAAARLVAASALTACVCLWLPAIVLGRALIRFIHAVPGVGQATIDVHAGDRTIAMGSVGFAQHTRWRSIRSGRFTWTLSVADKPVVRGSATVGDGAFDLVVMTQRTSVGLGIYRARAGEAGTTLLRVIHAAPELGAPELALDHREVLRRFSYAHATPYVTISPGVHDLAAMRPGDSTPLVSAQVRLSPGVAYSAIVLGSAGQRVRLVTVVDRGAPLIRRAASQPPTNTERGGATVLVVAPGDSLWRIARSRVGPDADDAQVQRELVAIWDLNARRIGTGDPNLIFPGQRLRLPD